MSTWYIQDLANAGAGSAATFGTDATAAVAGWWNGFTSFLYYAIRFVITNFFVAVVILIVAIFSVLWFQWHHSALSIAQNLDSCLIGPLDRELVNPIVGAVYPPVEEVMMFYNTGVLFVEKFGFDMLTLSLKCNGSVELLSSFTSAANPISKAIVGLVRMISNSTVGRPSNPRAASIVSSLLFGGLAEVTAGLSGFVSCYCTPCAYWLDGATMTLKDAHFQCAVANVIAAILELVAQMMRSIFRTAEWLIDYLSWVITALVGESTSGAPSFNASRDLPDLSVVVDELDAAFCCAGDFVDDVVNSGASVVTDAINVTTGISVEDLWTNRTGGYRIGGLIRAFGPAVAETTLFSWRLLINGIADGIVPAFKEANEKRLFDAYESMCIESSEAYYSLGPVVDRLSMAASTVLVPLYVANTLVGLIPVGTPLPDDPGTTTKQDLDQFVTEGLTPVLTAAAIVEAIVGPRAINHTCRSGVHLMRAIARLIREAPTYEEYAAGGYFDCMIDAMESIPTSLAADLNEVFDVVPDWRSCEFVRDSSSPFGWKLDCAESLFNGSIGAIVASPVSAAAELMNYAIAISENATSIDSARSVSSDGVFDALDAGIVAAGNAARAIVGIIPFELLQLTFPESNITFTLDDIVDLKAMVTALESYERITNIEIPRFIVRTLQKGNFVDWKFDPTDLEALIYAENELANTTAHALSPLLCFIRNANKLNECPYSPGGHLCPLDLVPCPDETLSAIARAALRLLDVIPSVLLNPSNFSDYEIFDPVLCELETAAAQLDDAFRGYDGLVVDLTATWGTNTTINFGKGLAGIVYSVVKLGTAINRLLLEAVHAIRRSNPELANDALCDTSNPVRIGSYCHPCNDAESVSEAGTEDPCMAFVADDSTCCQRTGECVIGGPCFDPGRIKTEVDAAVGSLTAAISYITGPTGVIDVHLQRAMERTGRTGAQLVRAALRALLVAPFAEAGSPDAMGPTLGNAACAIEEIGWAIGHAIASPVMLVSHILTLVSALVNNPDPNLSKYASGIANLSNAIAASVAALESVSSELGAFGYGSIGTLIEGDFTSERWANMTIIATCALENRLDWLQVAVRSVIASVDVSGGGNLCEEAAAASEAVGVATMTVKQILRVVGWGASVSIGNTETAKKMDIREPYVALRRMCVAIGGLVSGIMRKATKLIAPGDLDTYAPDFDAVGSLLTTLLNTVVSYSETMVQLFGLAFPELSTIADGFTTDPYEPVRIMAIALRELFISLADVLSIVSQLLGKLASSVADLLSIIFLDQSSPVVQILTATLRVIFAFFKMLVALSTGGVSSAEDDFVAAVSDLGNTLAAILVNIVTAFVDNILFGGLKIGSYGVFGCITHIASCVASVIFLPMPRLIDGSEPLPYERLALAAMIFPPTDACRKTLLSASDIMRNASVNSSNPFVEVLGYRRALAMYYRTGLCMRRLIYDDSVGLGKREAPPLEETCSDPLCVLDEVVENAAIAQGLGNAIAHTILIGGSIEESADAFARGLASAGISNDTVEYYREVFTQAVSGVRSATSKFTTDVARYAFDGPVPEGTNETLSAAMAVISDISDRSYEWFLAGRKLGKASKKNPAIGDAMRDKKSISVAIERGLSKRSLTSFTCSHNVRALTEIYSLYDPNIDDRTITCFDIAPSVDFSGCPSGGTGNPDDTGNQTPPVDFWSCQPWCPNCTNSSRVFVVPNPCPVDKCGGDFVGKAQLEGVCARLCGGPATTDIFSRACGRHSVGPSGLETWLESLGILTKFSQYSGLTVAGIFQIFDPDKRGGRSGDPQLNGPLRISDECTMIGRGSTSDISTMCALKCDFNDPSSYLSRALAAEAGNSSVQLRFFSMDSISSSVKLTLDMCTAFCSSEGNCQYSTRSLTCSDSVTTGTACMRACDLDWIGIDESSILPPPECVAISTLSCSAPQDLAAPVQFGSTCKCPPSTDNPLDPRYCKCQYELGIGTPPHIAKNRVDFLCPRVLKEPVNHYYRDFDYEATSESMRVQIVREFSYDPLVKLMEGSVDGLGSIEYDPPMQNSTVCSEETKYLVLTEYEKNSSGLFDSLLANASVTPAGWQYVGGDTWIAYPSFSVNTVIRTCDVINSVSCAPTNVPESVGRSTCAEWMINAISTRCPNDTTFSLPGGACSTVGGACYDNATYDNPIPASTCERDLYCVTGDFQATFCSSFSPSNMYSNLCGFVRAPISYDLCTYTLGTTSDARDPLWVYVRPDAFPPGPSEGDLTPTDFAEGVALPAYPGTDVTCDSVLVPPSDPDISGPSVTVGSFLAAFGIAGDPAYDDLGGYPYIIPETQLTFVGNSSVLHYVLLSHVGDLCGYLCPGDEFCVELLPLNCTLYRELYDAIPVRGTAAARLWLCHSLPDLGVITANMFPLSGPGYNAIAAGAITATLMPLGPYACLAYDGTFGNNDPAITTRRDACVMSAPSEPPDGVLTAAQCNNVKIFAADLAAEYARLASLSMVARDGESGMPVDTNSSNCTLRSCELPRIAPQVCTRLPAPRKIPTKPLPPRQCNIPLVMLCDWPEIAPYKWIPDNATEAFLDMLEVWYDGNHSATREASPLEELISKISEISTRVPRKRRDEGRSEAVKRVLSESTALAIGRSLEAAACIAIPGSSSCRRIESQIAAHGSDDRKHPMCKKDDDRRPSTVRDFVLGSWEMLLPKLSDMNLDCYVLCCYDYRDLLRRSCLWYETPEDGAIGRVVDSILSARAALCDSISPRLNCSARIVHGGLFNVSTVDFRKVNTSAFSWFDSIEFVKKLKGDVLHIFGSLFGIDTSGKSESQLFVAVVEKLLRRNFSEQFNASEFDWITDVNFDSTTGPVGLLYYLSIFTPFGVDCPKAVGDLRLFGVIPIYNPEWGTLPSWAPRAIYNITRWFADLGMIAPDSMIIDDGGCRVAGPISIPFTNECGCRRPQFKNCGETVGFADPLDTVIFLLDWLFPAASKSKWIVIPIRAIGLGGKLDRFRNVSSKSNFDDYLYCFILTLPGCIWAILLLPVFLVSLFFALWLLLAVARMLLVMAGALFIFVISWQMSTADEDFGTTATLVGGRRRDDAIREEVFRRIPTGGAILLEAAHRSTGNLVHRSQDDDPSTS